MSWFHLQSRNVTILGQPPCSDHVICTSAPGGVRGLIPITTTRLIWGKWSIWVNEMDFIFNDTDSVQISHFNCPTDVTTSWTSSRKLVYTALRLRKLLEVVKVKIKYIYHNSLYEWKLIISSVLENGLKSTFENVEVSVVDCPDLTQKPYGLACPGK